MKLERVHIQRYRSASDLTLDDIGALNVFIGKNNSGKSTILSSIDVFFRCIRNGRLVNINPPLGKRIDFSDQQPKEPISISLVFSLLPGERATLLGDIATEAPQLKNATDGLDPNLLLEVTVSITPEPENYSYVKSLQLVGTASASAAPSVARVLFSVNASAAAELARRQRTIQTATSDLETLTRVPASIDEDDFGRLKQSPAEAQSFFRYQLMRRGPDISRETLEVLDKILRESALYSEFRTKIGAFRDQIVAEAKKAENESLKNSIETFSGQQSSVPKYITNIVRTISEIRVLYLTERREPVGKAEARQLLSFKVTRGGPEKLRSIQETISGLLGVQVDAFESVSSLSSAADKNAEMDVDNFLLEVNGSGIKEALRLVLDVEFRTPSILLVEEPEVHLHPALETNVMRYLKRVSQDCQVFLSTHSTNFIDTAEMKNVYFVSKPKATTEVQLLNLEDAQSKLPNELGIRLSSLFMFDRLVFVEGPTDEAVIREWASTLKANLSQANVGFISMGGVRNFGHYANEAVFSFLTKRQVLIWFVIDRDERDKAEVAKLQGKLEGKAKIEVLTRRELENYLLVPHAMEEFIKMKQSMLPAGSYPEVDQAAISKAIEDCADALKDQAIGKRVVKRICTPIYPSLKWSPENRVENAAALLAAEFERLRRELEQAKDSSAQVVEETKREIEDSWVTAKSRLVPGDILLDEICKKFGVRFKKDTDGQKLAALMREHEIDPEIKDIIRSFIV